MLIGLLAAATPALADPSGTISLQGVDINVSPRVTPAGLAPTMKQVALDIEPKTEEAAQKLGFRSMAAVVDIDCAEHVSDSATPRTDAVRICLVLIAFCIVSSPL